ncbi:AraC family transcriptional regulator [uncultured Lutibacter sp.]|uniref:helix-turn-helix domain-containing protein n=1 Tax=uncultured Lutibacter sp. TaxID=437739 RepID=UPI002620A4E4|nr:helix-turn-helix domain-containing protein [uncultured Lutibacter sp.]
MEILLLIGAFQAVFFVVLVLSKKHKSVSDKILALWLSFFSVHLAFVYFSFKAGVIFYIDYGYLPSGVLVLYYSIMYVYTKSLISNENVFKAKWLVHLIPTIIVYISIIPFAQLPYEDKEKFVTNISSNTYQYFVLGIILLFVTLYLVAIFRLLNKHQITIRKMFSYEENISLNWIRVLAVLLTSLWVIMSSLVAFVYYIDITSPTLLPKDHVMLDMQGQLAFVVFVFLLGFFGIKQQMIYSTQISLKESATTNVLTSSKENAQAISISQEKEVLTEKYEKSGLNEEMASEIYANLNELMKNKLTYINDTLSLVELAKQLQVHPNHLSQVINEMEGKNFYNYINSLRITEFIRLASLPDNKKYTMISLAYDCGFNTKSTFNKHFKLVTGKTPTKFFSV